MEHAASRASLRVVGDWQVEVSIDGKTMRLDVTPPTLARVRDEKHETVAEFRPKNAGWDKGERCRRLDAEACTAQDHLVPASLVLKSGPGDAPAFREGIDYATETSWAQFGRLAGGAIAANAPVWVDYDAGLDRIDSIVLDAAGALCIRQGEPHQATPFPPKLAEGEVRVANIWLPGLLAKLTPDHLYPIIEAQYPEPAPSTDPSARTLLPRTWAKLHGEGELHILAWGDSVTCLPDTGAEDRWQNLFVANLHKTFPKARIKLTTVAWGGRNTDNFLAEPPGSPYNFVEKVLGAKADLVVSEFVNDGWMNVPQVREKYGRLLEDFRQNGSEWLIISPHLIRPDWMGHPTFRIEEDPRPYTAGLRQFCRENGVALADTARRWGHLLKEGIPYTTLFLNTINHPDERGHRMFARALMEAFRAAEDAAT